MELPYKIISSIRAFKGSNNCDHTSGDAFYHSYVRRKEMVIEGKMAVYKKHPERVNLKKFKEQIFYLKYAKENELEVREYITKYLEEQKLSKAYIDDYIEQVGGAPRPGPVSSALSRNEKAIKDEDD